ncbi:hypothetical protein ACIG5E_35435 [Kitasatospora sp. NPDC053057]|uniref:hypothetical protein n=1 Tax=Kitasatospora sp. NPDC053057 TaxID=3364062 RepID=UPI0037C8D2F1
MRVHRALSAVSPRIHALEPASILPRLPAGGPSYQDGTGAHAPSALTYPDEQQRRQSR